MGKFKEYLDENETIIEDEYSKEEFIEFINEMDNEEFSDLVDSILDELYDEDDLTESEQAEYDALETVEEKKFFKKKARELNVAKKQDRNARRQKARELKKYYKKNKTKIKVKAARYRKKVKRNPNIQKTHRK